MSYVHLTKTPWVTVADYQRVVAELGTDPVNGQLVHIVGETDGTLHIVDVWQSKEHADRFASERLFPAFDRAGVRRGPGHEDIGINGTVTVGSAVQR